MPFVFKATTTLDGLIDDLDFTTSPEDAEVIVVGGKKLDLDSYPRLRGIFKCGVGTDNLPFKEAEQRGVTICLPSEETRTIIFEETASFAAHLVLSSLYRDTGDLDTWSKVQRPALTSRNILVIGTGNIGSRVANKLGQFCDVTTFDASTDSMDKLEPMVRVADAITLHIPLNDKTHSFMNAEKLSWMKDGAALINTARGPIVDEEALYAELVNGRLFAALDVYSKEPYQGRLRELHPHHCLMSPHIASTCSAFTEGLAKDFRAFLQDLDGPSSND